jgi:hypothetical protein
MFLVPCWVLFLDTQDAVYSFLYCYLKHGLLLELLSERYPSIFSLSTSEFPFLMFPKCSRKPFLNLGTDDVLYWKVLLLCEGGLFLQVLRSIPGLYSLDVSSNQTFSCHKWKCLQILLNSSQWQNHPRLRTMLCAHIYHSCH